MIKDTLILARRLSPEIHDALINHENGGTIDSPDYKNAQDVLYKNYFCRIAWPQVLQDSMARFNRDIYDVMWGKYETMITGNFRDIDFMSLLPSISVPTLITCGAFDIARPESMREASHKIPEATLQVLENSSHFPHLEEPEAFVSVIKNFLQDHQR